MNGVYQPQITPDIRTAFRWETTVQRAFLEELAFTGRVTQAAQAVGKSVRSAYDLRHRMDGAAFRIGWDAAVLVARARVFDDLMERAFEGQEDVSVRDPDTGEVRRRRIDNGLGMKLLARLDRMAEVDPASGTEAALARIVSQDFGAFLDLVERGAGLAEAGLFIAAREAGTIPAFATRFDCEDGPETAVPEAEADEDDTPEAVAAGMRVWFDDMVEEWRTNFPAPEGFDGEEEYAFGDEAYQRALAPDELAIVQAREEARISAIRAAGELARAAWLAG